MSLSRTPLVVTDAITTLCGAIAPGAAPVYLPISPGPDDIALDCFNNAHRRVDREGGAILFGWAIWEWPRVFIEAEHHAVWIDPDGAWRDITPAQDAKLRRRLFLADPVATFDFDNPGRSRDNHRHALSDSPLVAEMFRVATERVALLNAIPGTGKVSPDLQIRQGLESTTTYLAVLQQDIARTFTPPKARCGCGSGKMFKQCHGRAARGR